jgi:hypothetical protein
MVQLGIRLFTDEYYTALGQFVAAFSEIECAMQVALWNISKIKSPVAQAVFSGVRADDACNKITRISVAENWTEPRLTEWKRISDRLGILRQFRNDLLHYPAEWSSEDNWVITNKDFVHTPEKIKNTPVTAKTLDAAMQDTHKLCLLLFVFLFSETSPKIRGILIDPEQEDTWLYKPPPRGGRPDRLPSDSQGQ